MERKGRQHCVKSAGIGFDPSTLGSILGKNRSIWFSNRRIIYTLYKGPTLTGRQTISQNNLVKTTFDWINRSTFYRQILRFSEQKLGNLIPQCCRVSLRGNRRCMEYRGS